MDRLRRFLDDLWFDLRERRLAPIVVAIAAAAVAVPVLLGGSSEQPPSSSAPPVEVIETQPAVSVGTVDGVRNAAERLAGREAKNPFRQQLRSLPEKGEIAATPPGTQDASAVAQQADAEAAAAAGQLAGQLSADASAIGGADSNATGPGVAVEPSTTPAATKYKTRTIVKLEQRSADVRFGRLGERHKIEGVDSLDLLPRRGDPVLVLLGVDEDEERATFDLASRVTSVWGKGRCAPAAKECDYLTLEPGEGAKLRYQPRRDDAEPVVYSLTLVQIDTKRVSG